MASFMALTSRIFVAGQRGLVGSAIVRALQRAGYNNLLLPSHQELDLTDAAETRRFFDTERPDYVFLAAAKVGGILANKSYPAEFIFQNLSIQTNVIDSAYQFGTKRLLFLGSSCIYPRLAPQPLKEEYLLAGPLESTNRPYAVAKIAGIEMCWAYNRQYGTQYLAVMPTNLYGPGDNYDLENSHVIPAMIRKMHEAKINGANELILWGTGEPRREFLYSDDMAEACVALTNLEESAFASLTGHSTEPPVVNIGCGEDMSIRELAERIAQIVGFRGVISFDASKPDGTPRKLLEISKIRAIGWTPRFELAAGLQLAYDAFLQEYVGLSRAAECV